MRKESRKENRIDIGIDRYSKLRYQHQEFKKNDRAIPSENYFNLILRDFNPRSE